MRNMSEIMGWTPHRSLLLRRLSHLGLVNPDQLRNLAVTRGGNHYALVANVDKIEDPGRDALSDEELAVAMCSAAQAYDPALIRCAAQLLSAPKVNFERLVHLARQERCLPILLEIARAAQEQEPTPDQVEGPWDRIWREQAEEQASIPPGRMPHPTRYVQMAGRDRQGRPLPTRWITRCASAPAQSV